MPTIHPLQHRVPGVRVGLFLLMFFRLPAEQLTLSVNSRVAPSCRAIAAPALQEALEAHLIAAGYPLAKAHSATLASDVDCTPVEAQSKSSRTVLHQCVSLSQAVSLPSAARAVLATTWRQCQSSPCAGKNCETAALAGARDLVDIFVSEQREKSARELKAVAGAAASIDRSAGISRGPDLTFFYYAIYIITCVAVLFRWQWHRFAN